MILARESERKSRPIGTASPDVAGDLREVARSPVCKTGVVALASCLLEGSTEVLGDGAAGLWHVAWRRLQVMAVQQVRRVRGSERVGR